MSEEVLFDVKHLHKYFPVDGKALKAVDDVSFQIRRGETFGLVGESGCGKSTLGRVLARIYQPTDGEVTYKGKSIAGLNRKEAKNYAFHVQMIFQDPYASLNPRMTIADIIKEGMRIHHIGTEQEINDRMYQLLDLVGLNHEHAQRFPYEFSGGQRQRVGIARALAIDPEFIVCDEPISALDVSIQAQVINLLKKLQNKLGLTYLFIAHDLSMVRYISDRVGVMYLGSLVEVADAEELYLNPLHPYTQALLSAILEPDLDQKSRQERIVLEGDVPSPIHVPPGCKFAGRCKYATDACRQGIPQLQDLGNGHQVACFRSKELFEAWSEY
ncbi:MAG: ABC transporter ATP-binding protein [Oscillospiraceae bacterium]|nr:ABC transporter ATP-binding protein [Oscillospiraceae bacterium]MBR1845874.1 ABC transporter ATP-binding protein [Oscillospiraceae bacterium]